MPHLKKLYIGGNMPKVEPVDFFLVHAPDTAREAATLRNILYISGFNALTYYQVYRGWTQPSIASNIYELLDDKFSFIFLGSPEFFKNDFLMYIAREATDQKKAIFTLLKANDTFPIWFTSSCITLYSDPQNADLGMNRLMDRLNRFGATIQFINLNT